MDKVLERALDIFESRIGDMGIYLGGADVGVPQ